MDDLAMTLHEHPRNSKVDILRIVAILLTINRDAVSGKSKIKATFEKNYWKDLRSSIGGCAYIKTG